MTVEYVVQLADEKGAELFWNWRKIRATMRAMRFLGLLLLAAVVRAAEPAASEGVSAVQGAIGGQLQLLQLPGAPALKWRTEVQPRRRGLVALTTADGVGTHVQIETVLDGGNVTWKIVDAKLELPAWESALAAQLGKAVEGLHFAGNVTVTGSGTLQGGAVVGEVVIAVKAGRLSNPDAGWALDGITLGGNFAVSSGRDEVRSTAPLTLTVATITTKRFGARNLAIHGTLSNVRTLALSSARVEIAGGDMAAGATSVSLSPLKFLAEVTINRIGLQDVAALVPSALRYGHGRIDGTAQLGWAEGDFDYGKGHLTLRDDEPAEVTLHPFPGLFTSWMDRRLRWAMHHVPRWLVRWPGQELENAELGKTAIEAKSLDVTFSHDLDEQGRSAIVRLEGVTKGPSRTQVDLSTNVYGPLKPFIRLGTEGEATFSIGK